jgi:hypothetical protein
MIRIKTPRILSPRRLTRRLKFGTWSRRINVCACSEGGPGESRADVFQGGNESRLFMKTAFFCDVPERTQRAKHHIERLMISPIRLYGCQFR